MVSKVVWDNYKKIINDSHDDFFQETIVWKKHIKRLKRYGDTGNTYDTINLKVLLGFNAFRSWPSSKETEAGVLDSESMVVYLNIAYLTGLGYITAEGKFDFDPGMDYFTYAGQKYRPSGDTPVAQAKDEPLLYMLILKRVTTETGTN